MGIREVKGNEKKFENLLRSEITKINRFATKRAKKNCFITGWFWNGVIDDMGFVELKCEICDEYGNRENDITFFVFMLDRRKSFVCEALSK